MNKLSLICQIIYPRDNEKIKMTLHKKAIMIIATNLKKISRSQKLLTICCKKLYDNRRLTLIILQINIRCL